MLVSNFFSSPIRLLYITHIVMYIRAESKETRLVDNACPVTSAAADTARILTIKYTEFTCTALQE